MQLTDRDIDGLVTWTLIRAAHQVERSLTRLFERYDLSPTQFGVLAHLATDAPMTQAGLAREILVRPQSMAALIEGLVKRGLLVRSGPRGRGRPNPVALSEEGAALLGRVWPAVEAANDLSRAGLTPAQSSTLNRQLHTLLHHEVDVAAPGDLDGANAVGAARVGESRQTPDTAGW